MIQLPPTRVQGDPAWEVAYLFPEQGGWSEQEYLDLPGNRLVEYSDGFIEVLPMPTTSHQSSLLAFYEALLLFARPRQLGKVSVAGIRVRLRKGKFRQPDVVFMLTEHAERIGEDYWRGADLVMEVVSGSEEDRRRDLVDKRAEYARARIPEYWIVDPQTERITVLRLSRRGYKVAGEYRRGSQAKSALLHGFAVDVDAILFAK